MQSTNKMAFCQSCGMPLAADEDFGTEQNGAKSADYCRYCYENGAFTTEETMEDMIESCLPHCSNNNPWPDEETARREMLAFFPTLKRWRNAVNG